MTAFFEQVAAKLAGEINQSGIRQTHLSAFNFCFQGDGSSIQVVTPTNPLVIILNISILYQSGLIIFAVLPSPDKSLEYCKILS